MSFLDVHHSKIPRAWYEDRPSPQNIWGSNVWPILLWFGTNNQYFLQWIGQFRGLKESNNIYHCWTFGGNSHLYALIQESECLWKCYTRSWFSSSFWPSILINTDQVVSTVYNTRMFFYVGLKFSLYLDRPSHCDPNLIELGYFLKLKFASLTSA